MKQYQIGCAVVRIHGTTPGNIKEATEKFAKKVMKCQKENQKSKILS